MNYSKSAVRRQEYRWKTRHITFERIHFRDRSPWIKCIDKYRNFLISRTEWVLLDVCGYNGTGFVRYWIGSIVWMFIWCCVVRKRAWGNDKNIVLYEFYSEKFYVVIYENFILFLPVCVKYIWEKIITRKV